MIVDEFGVILMKIISCLVFLISYSIANATYISLEEYPYPYKNPYYASVTGKFLSMETSSYEGFESYSFDLFPERSNILYYGNVTELEYYFYKHENPQAPLTFIVGGTGADATSEGNRFLGQFFHALGHHVILLPSPVNVNFILGAKKSSISGITQFDAVDLHKVMKLITQRLAQKKINPKEFNIAGYSLGGLDVAFVAKYDDENQKYFNFNRVLLVNPPYRLDVSARKIDDLFVEAIKLGPEGQENLKRKMFYNIFKFENNPPDVNFLLKKQPLPYPFRFNEVKALIGISFRDTLANMIVVSELIDSVKLINPGLESRDFDPTLDQAKRYSFIDFFNLVAFPYWNKVTGRKDSFDKAIEQNSLHGIKSYLVNNKRIRLIHTQDDIIMAPGEVDEMEQIFKERSIILPRGGHVGYLWFPKTYDYLASVLIR